MILLSHAASSVALSRAELTGGTWKTINGAHVYVEDGSGKILAGGAGAQHLIGKHVSAAESHGTAPAKRSGFHPIQRDAAGNYAGTKADDGQVHHVPEHAERLSGKGKPPPAWTNVHLSEDPKAKLQALGTDEKGRTQYRYSTEHAGEAAAAKFSRLKLFQAKRPELRAKIANDPSEEAAVLRLIDHTGFRVGSEADTGADEQAYGATTLHGEHIRQEGGKVFADFVGKKGVDQSHEIDHPGLAKELAERAAKAGPSGKLYDTNDSKVRKYLHDAIGNFKVKDLRTAVGTDHAAMAVKSMAAPTDAVSYEKARKAVGEAAAHKLGNTPKIALESYVAPEVFAPWQAKLANREQAGLIEQYAAQKGITPDVAAREWIPAHARSFREDFNARYSGKKATAPDPARFGVERTAGDGQLRLRAGKSAGAPGGARPRRAARGRVASSSTLLSRAGRYFGARSFASSLLLARSDDGSGHWITIGAEEGEDGKRHGGSPVFINGSGVITKGHSTFVNKTPKQVEQMGKDEPEKTRAAHAEARAAHAKGGKPALGGKGLDRVREQLKNVNDGKTAEGKPLPKSHAAKEASSNLPDKLRQSITHEKAKRQAAPNAKSPEPTHSEQLKGSVKHELKSKAAREAAEKPHSIAGRDTAKTPAEAPMPQQHAREVVKRVAGHAEAAVGHAKAAEAHRRAGNVQAAQDSRDASSLEHAAAMKAHAELPGHRGSVGEEEYAGLRAKAQQHIAGMHKGYAEIHAASAKAAAASVVSPALKSNAAKSVNKSVATPKAAMVSKAGKEAAKAPGSAQPLAEFARAAQKAADEHDVGFGDNKVYISHAYEAYNKAHPGLTLGEFKGRLKEASNARLIQVGRADLPVIHNPDAVRESHTNMTPGRLATDPGGGGGASAHMIVSATKGRRRLESAEDIERRKYGGEDPSAPATDRAGRVRSGGAGPHEMTRDEYRQSQLAPDPSRAPQSLRDQVDADHRRKIQEAREAGLDVPSEVLKDYPELGKGSSIGLKSKAAKAAAEADKTFKNVYHGTNAEKFDKFTTVTGSAGEDSAWGPGAYFAVDKAGAKSFGGEHLYTADVSLKNPFDARKALESGTVAKLNAAAESIGAKGLPPGFESDQSATSVYRHFVKRNDYSKAKVREILEKAGYDGIADPGEVVAFHPHQIGVKSVKSKAAKAATTPTNPDIANLKPGDTVHDQSGDAHRVSHVTAKSVITDTGRSIPRDKVVAVATSAAGKPGNSPSKLAPHEVRKAAEDTFAELYHSEHRIGGEGGLVPIHKIRDAIAKKYGDAAATHEALDDHLLRMQKEGKVRLLTASDGRDTTVETREKSIRVADPRGIGGEYDSHLFYVSPADGHEPPNPPKPKPDPAKAATYKAQDRAAAHYAKRAGHRLSRDAGAMVLLSNAARSLAG